MRPRRVLTVVRHTSQHPAWTKGAPYIHIEARLDMEVAKPSDLYRIVSAG